jgi:adenosylcobyric acid synthase
MSHVGKTVLVAALCRVFFQDGWRVAPFKAQNMSLNAAVTPDGGEIGRAQAMQAQAAGIEPTVEMNPILLKPEAEHRSQVVVLGKTLAVRSAREYYSLKDRLWPAVTEALDRLLAEYELVVVEGAGSPAEINLHEHDLANMRVARYAGAPVLLVGDIDRGGVFAQLVGTLALLEPRERELVKALVINKFRGDFTLLEPGLRMLEERTGIPVAGVLPYLPDLRLPEEDSLGLEGPQAAHGAALLDIAVVRLPRMANFDDFDPLRREPGVRVRYVGDAPHMGAPDLIILPGSKSTMADLAWLRRLGLDKAVLERHRLGAAVLGICGGYQMLGRRILDPQGVESSQGEEEGLGLLPVTTLFSPAKETHRAKARIALDRGLLQGCLGTQVEGYEIHMGRTDGATEAVFQVLERSGAPASHPDGAADAEGRVLGTYLHGLFHNRELRRALLQGLAARKGVSLPEGGADPDPDAEYDRLAATVRQHLDMELVYRIAGLRGDRR